jgi:futalosine hydrolase
LSNNHIGYRYKVFYYNISIPDHLRFIANEWRRIPVTLASPIGLISSISVEGKKILRGFANIHERVYCGLTIHEGTIHDKYVIYIVSGIGKTNASRGTALLIEKYSPGAIIHLGVGGAYPLSGLKQGDISIAEKEIYGDEGVFLEDGFHSAEMIGIPFLVKGRKKYFNEFPLDKKLSKMADRIARVAFRASCIAIESGPFITLSACTGTLKKAKKLERRFHAICENMEGAAVAHVCISCGIPMVEIRGISNMVGERDKKKWDIHQAAENCQRVVAELLKEI